MVATNPVELAALRRVMREYVVADHDMVTLKRPEIVPNNTGGVKRTGQYTDIDPQMFRLYPLIRRAGRHSHKTPDGPLTEHEYILVGLYTADVKPSDEFVIDGNWYKVDSVDQRAEDRVAANVTLQGKTENAPWAT